MTEVHRVGSIEGKMQRVRDSWTKLNQKQWGKMEFRRYWHLHWSLTVSQSPAPLVGHPVGDALVLGGFRETWHGGDTGEADPAGQARASGAVGRGLLA